MCWSVCLVCTVCSLHTVAQVYTNCAPCAVVCSSREVTTEFKNQFTWHTERAVGASSSTSIRGLWYGPRANPALRPRPNEHPWVHCAPVCTRCTLLHPPQSLQWAYISNIYRFVMSQRTHLITIGIRYFVLICWTPVSFPTMHIVDWSRGSSLVDREPKINVRFLHIRMRPVQLL
jgi:hypothetical protein